jgi:hypothetical protein
MTNTEIIRGRRIIALASKHHVGIDLLDNEILLCAPRSIAMSRLERIKRILVENQSAVLSFLRWEQRHRAPS